MYKNKNILITGGTGSLGNEIVKFLLKNAKGINKIIVFSRDEQKQFMMEKEFPVRKFSCMRYFLGDVRDLDRLKRAFSDVDYVIHAAALKHVPLAEYNPEEFIKTNILGAQNVITAALETNVKRVVALSTDKACAPINLYGATKLTSDKLFIAANNVKGVNPIKFSVVRYGNVMGSNGSVIPFFLKSKDSGVLTITDERMTRFNILLREGVEMVMHALNEAWGGEIFIPKIPSYNIMDLANAVSETCEKKIIGIRPGEKIHEEMISKADSFFSYDLGKYFVILPSEPVWSLEKFISKFNAIKVPENFTYNSGNNDNFLSIKKLSEIINKEFYNK